MQGFSQADMVQLIHSIPLALFGWYKDSAARNFYFTPQFIFYHQFVHQKSLIMSSVTPFQINIPNENIQRLRQKLLLTDFPDEMKNLENEWARGVPLAIIKRLALYWAEEFDWRRAEASLNSLPQFKTRLCVDDFGDYDIHFVHQKSDVRDAIPLLFLHSWPGGFFEVSKMLPLMRGDEHNPGFHVVAPSLVDFGFSSSSKKVCVDRIVRYCQLKDTSARVRY